MSESEDKLRAYILEHLEFGYEVNVIINSYMYKTLIEIWGEYGHLYTSKEEIGNIFDNFPNNPINNFENARNPRTPLEASNLLASVEDMLKSTEVKDDEIVKIVNQNSGNSIALLVEVLENYQSILGNDFANMYFMVEMLNILANEDYWAQNNRKSILIDQINMRFIQGYPREVILKSLLFKILLMEWVESAIKLLGSEKVVELFSKTLELEASEKNKLIPRNAEDSLILTDELLKNLEDLEIHDPLLEDIKLMDEGNAFIIFQKIVDKNKNEIGLDLLQGIIKSTVFEMSTQTANFDSNK
jgi:hypothetical protein